MKKQLNFLIPIFILFFYSQSSFAQTEIDNLIVSLNSGIVPSNHITLDLNKSSNMKSVNIPHVYKPISIDESKFSLKVSADFGSYVIPNTNYLKIVASDGKVYTNAKLVNKQSGKQIFSMPLDLDKNVVDMTFTKSGVYSLILSNEKGEKYTEDIMIM